MCQLVSFKHGDCCLWVVRLAFSVDRFFDDCPQLSSFFAKLSLGLPNWFYFCLETTMKPPFIESPYNLNLKCA